MYTFECNLTYPQEFSDVMHTLFRMCNIFQNKLIEYGIDKINESTASPDYISYDSLFRKQNKTKDEQKEMWEHKAKWMKALSLTHFGLTYKIKEYKDHYLREHKHLDSSTCGRIAEKVGGAFQKYLKHHSCYQPQKNLPTFKKLSDLKSVCMSKPESGQVRYDQTDASVKYFYSRKKGDYIAAKLVVPNVNEREHDYFSAHFSAFKMDNLSYIRIVKNSSDRYAVQFVMDGDNPFDRYKQNGKALLGVGKVGIDMGPKHIGISSETKNIYIPICEGSERFDKEIKTLERHANRQLKQNNPDCFKANGTYIKGTKLVKSKGYMETLLSIKQLHHKLTVYRETEILHLIKSVILPLGNDFYLENTSQKSWQKNFGRSVGRYAPGFFIEKLKYNVDKYGGKINVLPLNLALSQHCVCGSKEKKGIGFAGLSVREHECKVCGANAQRDIFSALLARSCIEVSDSNWGIDFDLAKKNYNKISVLTE